MGELPLPQQSPPSGTRRERELGTPLSASASGSPLNPLSQNEMPRAIAGSRRVNKDIPFIRPTERAPLHKSSPQLSQREPLSSPAHTFSFNIQSPQQAHSQKQSYRQMREIQELGQTISAPPPFTNAERPVFSLPVYTNELERVPSDGQLTFSAQAHPSQPQAQSPQLDPQTNYWYTVPSNANSQDSKHSESTSHAGPSGASSSYAAHYPPAPTPQRQPHPSRHHPPRGIPLGGFSSTSEMSPLTRGPYGMYSAEVEAGSISDSMTTAYTQRQETPMYGLGPMVPQMGSSAAVSPSPRSSSGSSMENAYRGMVMDTMPDRSGGHYQHQHQAVPQQHEQQSLPNPFTVDSDTGAMWPNVPTGFECVKSVLVCSLIVVTYLFPRFYPSPGWINGVHTLRMLASQPKGMYTTIFLDKLCPLMHLFWYETDLCSLSSRF